nr:hypothetical protein [Cupriavidus oxalaticus]
MTGTAVRHCLHQVGAAVPRVAARGLGANRAVVEEQQVPHRQQRAHAIRKAQLRRRVALRHRRDFRAQVGIQRGHVVGTHAGVGRVRHGRIQALAVARHALAQGAIELGQRIGADAGGGVGGDIGRMERADGGADRQPAGKWLAAFAGMACGAVGDAREIAAAFDLLRLGGARGQRRTSSRAGNQQRQGKPKPGQPGQPGQPLRRQQSGGAMPPGRARHGVDQIVVVMGM